MISSIPTVEAYYISLKKDNEEKKSSLEVASNTISMAYDDLQIRWLSNLPVVGAVIAGFWEELEEMTSVSIAVLKLRRLSDDGHFKVIRSQEELSEFENANGNAWIRFGHCTSCLFDNSSVKLCKARHAVCSRHQARTMSRVWGGTAFAKRSGAMKAPVGLLSVSAVCDSRWRGVAPTSATPTRSLRKCRRIAEVKSQWSTTFSRIENLWPRDGSCPLPLRSKRIFNKCFRIVKAQKISKGSLLV